MKEIENELGAVKTTLNTKSSELSKSKVTKENRLSMDLRDSKLNHKNNEIREQIKEIEDKR